MQPMLRVRCAQGWLTITETFILVELPGGLRSSQLARAAFTGLDMKLTLLAPFMTRYRLTFHGQGAERLRVGLVKGKDARQVKALLTGH